MPILRALLNVRQRRRPWVCIAATIVVLIIISAAAVAAGRCRLPQRRVHCMQRRVAKCP